MKCRTIRGRAKTAYFDPEYLNVSRFTAYGYQVSELVELCPDSILEIGSGNGVVTYALRNSGLNVTTVDNDPDLQPDIIGSVTNLPVASHCFDVASCFEVLEHLPFTAFERAMQELFRVVRRYAVLSLPDGERFYRLEMILPFRQSATLGSGGRDGRVSGGKRAPVNVTGQPGQTACGGGGPASGHNHHWQINVRGCSLNRITRIITDTGFQVEKNYRVWERPEHHFFVLRKAVVQKGARPGQPRRTHPAV
jgi:SAM-dependent methyltransferase